MLAKARRLSAHQVKRVLREGLRARSGFLSARFVRTEVGKEAFAAVVSLKVARNAVGRNKARRALYAAVAAASLPPVKAAILLERLPQGSLRPSLSKEVPELFTQVRSVLAKRT